MPLQKTELTTKIEKLKALQADTERLQREIVDQRPAELAGLHVAYGFEDVNEFIKAVKDAASKAPAKKAGKVARGKKAAKLEKKAGKPGRPKKVKAEKTEGKARGRARITDEVKAQVKDLVAAGKSGAEIAKQLGISLPSVQNIKKASGLVKTRGPRAKAVKVEEPVAVVEAPAAPAAPAPVSDTPAI